MIPVTAEIAAVIHYSIDIFSAECYNRILAGVLLALHSRFVAVVAGLRFCRNRRRSCMKVLLSFIAMVISLLLVSVAIAGPCAIGGCDETSEVLSWQGQSWIVNGSPTPGSCPTPDAHHHLVISELCVGALDNAEFIELCNTTGSDIYLNNLWVTDDCNSNDNDYVNIVNNGPWSFPADDFIARFPPEAYFPNNSCIVIAPDGNGFFGTYGFYPDYELKSVSPAADMITIGGTAASNFFNDDAEMVAVFCWEGNPGVSGPDRVCDIDYVVWGDNASAIDKTGICIDGPDPDALASCYLNDTGVAFQFLMDADNDADPMPHDVGFSAGRQACKDAAEICTGGNACVEGATPTETSTWGSLKILYR
jgi:hypothetical protein